MPDRTFDTPLYPYARVADQDSATPRRHPVVVVGAGPVGLAAAVDLAQRAIPVLLLDDNDSLSTGSRAICFSKHTLDIADRLGVGQALVDRGVQWSRGKVFFGRRQVYDFDLQAEAGHARPAFINLQQYHFERILLDRLNALARDGAPVEIRGRNRVTGLDRQPDHVTLSIDTPDGPYALQAAWLIACDGANSSLRAMLGQDFIGRVFEDNFLIADVRMQADFPTERWFWFDPPFNPGQSALLHKQPEGIWRIDLQLGWDIDRAAERQPEKVIPRLKAMLGDGVDFTLEWVSIYTFQCRRMDRFRAGRVFFAGDSAHQVSPFGARGANSGIQDADNLCWKLAAVIDGAAGPELLDSYDTERRQAADENILQSTRSTDFITPKSAASRLLRDAVLALAERHAFARPMVNSGRLSTPCSYRAPVALGPDALPGGPAMTAPGCACPDAPLDDGYLLQRLGGGFTLVTFDCPAPPLPEGLRHLALDAPTYPEHPVVRRFLGEARQAAYLLRPDRHVAARWQSVTARALQEALALALARKTA